MVVQRQGIKWELHHPKDNRTRAFLWNDGIWDEPVRNFALKVIKEGNVCIDIGANSGYFTTLFAKLVGDEGQVIAFEPHPKFFERMMRNVALNHFRNLSGLNMGLSNEEGALLLTQNGDNASFDASFFRPPRPEWPNDEFHNRNEFYSIPVSTLDKELQKMGVQKNWLY